MLQSNPAYLEEHLMCVWHTVGTPKDIMLLFSVECPVQQKLPPTWK